MEETGVEYWRTPNEEDLSQKGITKKKVTVTIICQVFKNQLHGIKKIFKAIKKLKDKIFGLTNQ